MRSRPGHSASLNPLRPIHHFLLLFPHLFAPRDSCHFMTATTPTRTLTGPSRSTLVRLRRGARPPADAKPFSASFLLRPEIDACSRLSTRVNHGRAPRAASGSRPSGCWLAGGSLRACRCSALNDHLLNLLVNHFNNTHALYSTSRLDARLRPRHPLVSLSPPPLLL